MSEEKSNNGFGDFEGVIVKVLPERSVGAKGFRVREIVVDNATPDAKWRNPVQFTFKKDKCDLLAAFEQMVGRSVKIHYVIDGREWQGRFFVDLTGLKIEKADTDLPEPAEPPADAEPSQDDLDGMPF